MKHISVTILFYTSFQKYNCSILQVYLTKGKYNLSILSVNLKYTDPGFILVREATEEKLIEKVLMYILWNNVRL